MAFSSLLQKIGLKDTLQKFQKESSFLGVDIGSSSIKIVQLRKERERAVLETYGELSLAGYAKEDVGRAVRLVDTRIAEALKDVIKESQAKAKRAVVSISLKDSFLTTIEMPMLSAEELKEAVPYEARKYVPIPITETTLDWWILPSTKGDSSSSSSLGSQQRKFVTVLLAAVPNDAIKKYKNIFTNAGLEVAAFEIEVFSFVRAALRQNVGISLMIDLGAASTKMMIVDAGIVRSVHSFDHGMQELTLTLSQSLNLDFTRAEMLKRQVGIEHKPETEGTASVLEPILDVIISEGERFLLDWKRKGGGTISKVFLGGGGAMLKGVTEVMVKRYGVEVEVVNPFSKVVYPAFLAPSLKDIGTSFINAIGLALREF